METDFCVLCKKKLIKPSMFGFIGEQVHEFEDGSYCDKCAKIVITKRRK